MRKGLFPDLRAADEVTRSAPRRSGAVLAETRCGNTCSAVEILDLSKIQAGRMGLELSSFDRVGLVEGAVTLMHERASRQDLSLLPDAGKGLG